VPAYAPMLLCVYLLCSDSITDDEAKLVQKLIRGKRDPGQEKVCGRNLCTLCLTGVLLLPLLRVIREPPPHLTHSMMLIYICRASCLTSWQMSATAWMWTR
jgi:hypothetical protein